MKIKLYDYEHRLFCRNCQRVLGRGSNYNSICGHCGTSGNSDWKVVALYWILPFRLDYLEPNL